MTVRLIAMDMDGTLLDGHNGICPENVSALQKAHDLGVTIAIASGRFPDNAAQIVEPYGFFGPIIGLNGCEIITGVHGELLVQHRMQQEAVCAVYETLEKAHAEYFVFTRKRVTTSNPSARHHSELSSHHHLETEYGVTFGHGQEDVLKALTMGVCKFFVLDNGDLPTLSAACASIPGVQVTRSSRNNIELIPTGISKGTAIEELAAFLNIPLKSVMTLGDEENDLPMLKKAGYGVAMGNAPDEIKAQVRYQTARFDEAGVAKAVQRFVLHE